MLLSCDWTDGRKLDDLDARGQSRLARVLAHAGHRRVCPAHVMESAVVARRRRARGRVRSRVSSGENFDLESFYIPLRQR